MTIDEITDILQAINMHAELRVAVPGNPASAHRIIGITKSVENGKVIGWLLTEALPEPVDPHIFAIELRIRG